MLFRIAFDVPLPRARNVMGSPFVPRVENIAVRVGRSVKESAALVKTRGAGRDGCCAWLLDMFEILFGTVPGRLGTQC